MVNIRIALKKDIPILQKLSKELFVDNSQYDPDINLSWSESERGEKYFSKILKNKNSYCLIAEVDSVPAGYLSAHPLNDQSQLSKYIEIDNLCVASKFQSKGIGSDLIKACLIWAKKKGYQIAYVSSYYNNVRAAKFYKRNGFAEFDLGLTLKI